MSERLTKFSPDLPEANRFKTAALKEFDGVNKIAQRNFGNLSAGVAKVIGAGGRVKDVPLVQKDFRPDGFLDSQLQTEGLTKDEFIDRTLELHALLKQANIPTFPTLRKSTDNKLYATDLNAGDYIAIAADGIVPKVEGFIYHSESFGEFKVIPNNVELMLAAAKQIAESATQHNISLWSDAVFFLIPKAASEAVDIDLLIGDLDNVNVEPESIPGANRIKNLTHMYLAIHGFFEAHILDSDDYHDKIMKTLKPF